MRLDPHGEASSFPTRKHLPHIAGTPTGAAWFWGGNDELGRLNLLTPERIQKATSNVISGQVISLDLPLNTPGPAIFGKKSLQHKISATGPGTFDDQLSYNTQSSSQWDGFRHFADPGSGFLYNGLKTDDISLEDGDDMSSTTKLGIDAWTRHGIAGRGVLLDVYDFKKGDYDPFTAHPISASDLEECAKAQGVTFETGDILLVRTGWLNRYLALEDHEKKERAEMDAYDQSYAGLESSEEVKDFLHDTYFAAAATDSANFEVWPPSSPDTSLHASLLPLWGMPIGELWDLETLSVKCKELGRWTFLLTSAPGNIPGGVGSPPNALAML